MYEGEYVGGKRCGIGTLSTVQGFRFSGFWTDGRRNGQAKAAYPDGSIFDGFFKDDQRHGEGKVTFSNGDCFEGSFEDDLPNGMGKYYHHGFGTYHGNFKNGHRSGSGAELHVARKDGSAKWRRFDGVFEFNNGDVMVVNWKQGLPHGYGVCVCARSQPCGLRLLSCDAPLRLQVSLLQPFSFQGHLEGRAAGRQGHSVSLLRRAQPPAM